MTTATERSFADAVAAHQAGDLAAAREGYRRVLEVDPGHVDALHLYGVVELQSGRADQAVEWIGRAAKKRPAEWSYWSNLSEALRGAGRPAEAVAAARQAVALKPDAPSAAQQLAASHLAAGDPESAVALLNSLLKTHPDHVAALNTFSTVLKELNRPTEAIAVARRALVVDPRSVAAHVNLAQWLMEQGDFAEAVEHVESALRLAPNSADARNMNGNILRRTGRPTEARREYFRALRARPKMAVVYYNLGRAAYVDDRAEEAAAWYTEAVRHDPKSVDFHTAAATAWWALEEAEASRTEWRAAAALDPTAVEPLFGLARIAAAEDRADEAAGLVDEALRRRPTHIPGLLFRADLLEQAGRGDDAESVYQSVLDLEPTNLGAVAGLSQRDPRGVDPERRGILRRVIDDPDGLLERRARAAYVAGAVDEAQGRLESAAAMFEAANRWKLIGRRRRGDPYDPERHLRFTAGLRVAFTPERIAALRAGGSASNLPIFVFGLPRSGTTLLEQILAGHSKIHGGGERKFGRKSFQAIATGEHADEMDCLDRWRSAGPDDVTRIADQHLQWLTALEPTASRVVDKLPDNYLYIGLLQILFPNALFIHSRRDPRATSLSCWKTDFARILWSWEKSNLQHRVAEYARMIEAWSAAPPPRTVDADYSETVADVEAAARRLIEACGLDWEPACVEFHRTERVVRTASVRQVRRPVYTDSIDRWRRYEPWLGDLFAGLPAEAPRLKPID
ncbi:MAG: tetratricopeptide repeat-containing sulfotransferase family protein [Planctomycetia bacterium]